jgi:phosphoribosylformimino-5-aminoimidazole carboxamide ribotide isomerase
MDIYPAIDLKGGKCVRLVQGQFDDVTTYSDDPVQMAERWRTAGAKWLHVVDLDGARTGDNANIEVVRSIVSEIGLPVQFGGGMRSAEAVERMLNMGVARVVIGTAASENPEFAAEMFRRHGSSIAVGVDAKEGFVAVHGWQTTSAEPATDFVVRMAGLGAQRFIFTDIARDGMLQGVNTLALEQVAAVVPGIPVIASGGVATIDDIIALVAMHGGSSPNVDGVIVGKALYAGTVTLEDVLQKAAV